MISKIFLLIIAVIQLLSGAWAGNVAFQDTTIQLSTLAMMGMLGSLFHSGVLIAALRFPLQVRKTISLLLLLWHIPEALLIARFGMGIPAGDQMVGIATHSIICVLAIISWFLAKEKPGLE